MRFFVSNSRHKPTIHYLYYLRLLLKCCKT